MSPGEKWCLDKILKGELKLDKNGNVLVFWRGRMVVKVPDQHPLSGRFRFRFGPKRWTVYRNRLIWIISNKKAVPDNCQIDHKNLDRLDDCVSNLRCISSQENSRQGNEIQTEQNFQMLIRWFEFVSEWGREPKTEEENLLVNIGF